MISVLIIPVAGYISAVVSGIDSLLEPRHRQMDPDRSTRCYHGLLGLLRTRRTTAFTWTSENLTRHNHQSDASAIAVTVANLLSSV